MLAFLLEHEIPCNRRYRSRQSQREVGGAVAIGVAVDGGRAAGDLAAQLARYAAECRAAVPVNAWLPASVLSASGLYRSIVSPCAWLKSLIRSVDERPPPRCPGLNRHPAFGRARKRASQWAG